MSELMGVARFSFHPGRAEDFKRLSARCVEIVRTQDSGTLQYDIFLDEDETAAVVIERYRDVAALDEHLAHIGDDLMAEILATGTVEGETLGELSAERRAQLRGGPVRALSPWASMEGFDATWPPSAGTTRGPRGPVATTWRPTS